jgi:hypothetical protein
VYAIVADEFEGNDRYDAILEPKQIPGCGRLRGFVIGARGARQ